MQNQYFSLKINGFSSLHPYQGSAIWRSNSLDKTATPFLILDRRLDFWSSKSWIFWYMQRNPHFLRKLTNVSRKITTFLWKSIDSQASTPIEDPRSDLRILSTKQPLHFRSSIGVSIPGPPKAKFLSLWSEIVTFSESWRVYHAKSLLFHENPWILKQAPLSRSEPPKAEFLNVCSEIFTF